MANLSSSVTERENYVRRLQEWAQGRGLPLPGYRETPSEEMIDSYNFRVQFGFVVSVPTMESVEGRGDGKTKKDAKQAAAKALYETLTDAPVNDLALRLFLLSFVVSTKFHFDETISLAGLMLSSSSLFVVRSSCHIYGNFATL